MQVLKNTIGLQLAPVALCILILKCLLRWQNNNALFICSTCILYTYTYYKYTGDIMSRQFQSKIEADRMNDSAILLQLVGLWPIDGYAW